MDSSCRFALCGSYFNKILLEKCGVCMPKPVAFFCNDPANIRPDTCKIRFPQIFVHFSDETSHRNTRCPDDDMNDSCVRENQSPLVVSGLHVRLHLLCNLNERRHPETLIVDRFCIEKVFG